MLETEVTVEVLDTWKGLAQPNLTLKTYRNELNLGESAVLYVEAGRLLGHDPHLPPANELTTLRDRVKEAVALQSTGHLTKMQELTWAVHASAHRITRHHGARRLRELLWQDVPLVQMTRALQTELALGLVAEPEFTEVEDFLPALAGYHTPPLDRLIMDWVDHALTSQANPPSPGVVRRVLEYFDARTAVAPEPEEPVALVRYWEAGKQELATGRRVFSRRPPP
jgi:hypothetical protein